jgi:hypothetical protein
VAKDPQGHHDSWHLALVDESLSKWYKLAVPQANRRHRGQQRGVHHAQPAETEPGTKTNQAKQDSWRSWQCDQEARAVTAQASISLITSSSCDKGHPATNQAATERGIQKSFQKRRNRKEQSGHAKIVKRTEADR